MTAVVVDTNVAVVANGRAKQASLACVKACISALVKAVREQIVVADLGLRIFSEYRAHLSPSGQPGVGDMFFKHVWLNQANVQHCELVELHPVSAGDDDFEEFPGDPELARFDRSDRKFVAAAVASKNHPAVLNASDTDWWHCQECLARHGIQIVFLCPELMDRQKLAVRSQLRSGQE